MKNSYKLLQSLKIKKPNGEIIDLSPNKIINLEEDQAKPLIDNGKIVSISDTNNKIQPSINNTQSISLLAITNDIELCRRYLFKNQNCYDENIIILTKEEHILPPNHKTKFYQYEWDNNFSNALNFGITKCTKDWILRLDSDEYIYDDDIEKIYKHIQYPDYDYYLINIFTFHENPFTNRNPKMRSGFLPRLWRNNKGVKFDYIIHEQNYLSLQHNHLRGGIINNLGIFHFGELHGNKIKNKHEYYHELIKKQVELTPNEAKFQEFLGNYYFHKQQYKDALPYIQRASELCHPEKLTHYLNKRMIILNKMTIKENNDISIIMPVYNEFKLTDELLTQIEQNTIHPKEIILIDNNSTENMFSLINKYNKLNIKYVRNNINIGVCQAWNQGINLAQNELLCFLNNDIIINKTFFEKILETMQDQSIGMCVPNTFKDKSKVISLNESVKLKELPMRLGWAFTMRKDIINKKGRIPDKLIYWYGDDYLYLITKKTGYKTVVMVNNIIYHYESITLNKMDTLKEREQDRIVWENIKNTIKEGCRSPLKELCPDSTPEEKTT